MKCIKCGTELDFDARFCTTCGAKVEPIAEVPSFEAPVDEVPAYEAPVEEPKQEAPAQSAGSNLDGLKGMGVKKLATLAVGTLLMLIGLFFVCTSGNTITSTSFGADFYTYTYRGLVVITELLSTIVAALGWLIVAAGAVIDVIALRD